MLTTHTTCSQLAVHYSDFQLKVTLKFRMTTITRQWDSAIYYAPGVQLEGMMKTTRNLNYYNQLLD